MPNLTHSPAVLPVETVRETVTLPELRAGDTVGYIFTGSGFRQYWIRADVVAVDSDAGIVVIRSAAATVSGCEIPAELLALHAADDELVRWPACRYCGGPSDASECECIAAECAREEAPDAFYRVRLAHKAQGLYVVYDLYASSAKGALAKAVLSAQRDYDTRGWRPDGSPERVSA